MMVVSCTLVGCAQSSWQTVRSELQADHPTLVEGQFRFGRPYIQATVNGVDAGLFLFDTGAPINSISPEAAERYGLRVIGEQASFDANRNRRVSPLAVADSVGFGPMQQLDVRFLVQDRPRLSDGDVVGVIGVNGLQGVTIDLDPFSDRIAITDERLNPADEEVVPVRRRSFAVSHIPIRFGDPDQGDAVRTIWALIDTGNSGGLRLDERSSVAVADVDRTRPVDVSVGSHDIPWATSESPVRSPMLLGNTRIDGIEAVVHQRSNNVGAALLGQFRLRIDGVGRLAALTRPDGAKRLVSIERFGFRPLVQYSDGIRPGFVLPGSLADRHGITHAHMIIAINGHEPGRGYIGTRYWPIPPDRHNVSLVVRPENGGDDVEVEFPIGW